MRSKQATKIVYAAKFFNFYLIFFYFLIFYYAHHLFFDIILTMEAIMVKQGR